ncbi:suppressor of fused domain protein [Priestia aryabhattai]|uniref:Suppressor of fused domain protein n=1 Tax=Priestia aryabhattai TaxID=412384 RepID=A0AAX6N2R0_PRIAR|nr:MULTISPECIES: suppressor of fused domain protein [Priestia]MDU9690178.1 suppressor of fused domain protein [Priestia aryabhattai]MED5244030.1 suppressor of fused domain protein [Priestia sp. LL-8]
MLHRLKKLKNTDIYSTYCDSFGPPSRIYKFQWQESVLEEIEKSQVSNDKGSLFIIEFSPQNDRPVWTYITIGMSKKKMINGLRSELIWLNEKSNQEIIELLVGLSKYPFYNHTSLDYGQTISNSETHSSFKMNSLLICPPIMETENTAYLLDIFDKKRIELFWLLPIHQEEKNFIKDKQDFTKLLNLWIEKDIDPVILCNSERESTL